MSGGSLDYGQDKIDEIAEIIRRRSRKPLHEAFAKHLDQVGKAVHDLEWVLSCDYSEGAEMEAIKAVLPPYAVLEHLVDTAEQTTKQLKAALEEAKALKK